MKYILNKTPIRTTESFNINDIKLDLDITDNNVFHDYIIDGEIKKLKINKRKIRKKIETKIGLKYNNYYDIDVVVPKNVIIDKPIFLKYNFHNNDSLIENINIIYEKSSKANIILYYESLDNNKHYHHLILNIKCDDYANSNISIINMLNDNSNNLVEVSNQSLNNSSIKINIFDIGSNIKINKVYSELFDYAKHYLNNIYIGVNNNILDMNYHVKNIGEYSESIIKVEGCLNGTSHKNFKGIIDFVSGAKKAIGEEKENCVLLSDRVVSRSLPMLLCEEEDVYGKHGVSSSKIDKDKLFYLNSRGINDKDARRIIINANFDKIIKEIKDPETEEKVINNIKKMIF